MRCFVIAGVVLPVALCAAHDLGATVHHDLQVVLNVTEHRIEVTDRVRFSGDVAPDAAGGYRFVLHGGLAPAAISPGWRIEQAEGPVTEDFFGLNATSETVGDGVPLEGWRLIPGEGADEPVELRYAGVIHHDLAASGEEYQLSFSETPGRDCWKALRDAVFCTRSGARSPVWLPRRGKQWIWWPLL